MTEQEVPGPVDFVLIEFPEAAPTSGTAEALTKLVDSGVVRLYDIVVIHKHEDGQSYRVNIDEPADEAATGFEAFAGAHSGLFDDNDVSQAADALEPGTIALLVAYENAWAVPFVAAAYGAGGQLVASERIPAQVLIDALEPVG